MLFANVALKKGVACEHCVQEPPKDLQKLGYHKVILECDGEPALKSVQEEIKRRKEAPAILETSGVGDTHANGSTERTVQALGKQAHVHRQGLKPRLVAKMSNTHANVSWVVAHVADILSQAE